MQNILSIGRILFLFLRSLAFSPALPISPPHAPLWASQCLWRKFNFWDHVLWPILWSEIPKMTYPIQKQAKLEGVWIKENKLVKSTCESEFSKFQTDSRYPKTWWHILLSIFMVHKFKGRHHNLDSWFYHLLKFFLKEIFNIFSYNCQF